MAWKASVLLLCFILGVFAQQRVQRSIIDDYSVESDTLVIVIGATTVLPTQITNSVSNSGILGGERDLILRANTGSVGRVFTCGVNSGAWNVATPNGASGIAETQYDGADNSATLNPTGLGGVDLTTSQVDSFKLTIETDITTTYIISVTDMNGATSTRNIPIPGAPNVSNDYYILFSDFTGNANFANVGSVVITIQGFDNVDTLVQIFALAAPSSTPPPAASQSPRPEEKDSWYRFDDEDDGKSPCGEEADENTVFLADNNIIYYYFYGFQRPYIYVSNPNNNGAAFLIPSIFACILAFFAL